MQDIELAQEFDVAYYNYTPRTDYLVYPEGGWNSEVHRLLRWHSVRQPSLRLDLEFFLTSVQQPQVFKIRSLKDYGTGVGAIRCIG